MHSERETTRLIRDAVKRGTLIEPFTPADVNLAIGIDYAGAFLPKHRVGNHGFKGKLNTEHFAQVKRGFYQLKRFHSHPHERWMASTDPAHLHVDLLGPYPELDIPESPPEGQIELVMHVTAFNFRPQ
jgi:hypothetical protein